jgi:hypothetical protein
MAILEWHSAVDLIAQHIVRIATPRGTGTGFLVSHGKTHTICGIATAAHVVDHSHFWEEPIRIEHPRSGSSLLIRHNQRAIFLDSQRDTAALLFEKSTLPLPTETLSLAPDKMYLKTGNEIGWLGFPAISSELCFFGGRISAWLQNERAYLVDGVAINGVSGGPAFHITIGGILIMGVVSAYMPNRATGETLPGLGVIRDVSQFHELAPTFASLEEAKSEETPPSASPVSTMLSGEPEEPIQARRSFQ